jgi:3-ketosteroid 9alpha-monooxygenase subunit B
MLWQRALITRIVDETSGCRSLELELDRATLVEPGQHALVAVTIDGVRHVRCYSFSNVASFGEPARLTVKRCRGAGVSAWFNDTCRQHDTIEVGQPAGDFVVRPGTGPLLFLAAGSGITPIFAMLRSALAETKREVTLLYANRSASEAIFAAQLDRLGREYAGRFKVDQVFTAQGRASLDAALWRTIADTCSADMYLCGPAGFMLTCKRITAEQGLEAERIFSESFVSSETDVSGGEAISVIVERHDGTKVAVQSSVGATLLAALIQSGAPHVGICGGQTSCGTCRISIGAPWDDTLAPASRSERRLLQVLPNPTPAHRLACQVRLTAAHSNLVFACAPLQ